MAKFKIEDLRADAERHGWQLLSKEYKNLDTDLDYICNRGHSLQLPYKKTRKGFECPICKEFNGNTKMKIAIKPKEKPKGIYRILALDQSSKITGYSIFDNETLVHYGIVEIKGKTPPIRFIKLCEWIQQMIKEWNPDFVMIEDIQLQANDKQTAIGVTTFKILAELVGVIEVFFTLNNIQYDLANVAKWRKEGQIKGRTREEKKQSAIDRVKKCYGVDVTNDEADAILIGRYAVELRRKEKTTTW